MVRALFPPSLSSFRSSAIPGAGQQCARVRDQPEKMVKSYAGARSDSEAQRGCVMGLAKHTCTRPVPAYTFTMGDLPQTMLQFFWKLVPLR